MPATLLATRSPHVTQADESDISFWLPALHGSLAAVPGTPGWSVAAIYYHTSVNASGAAAASRNGFLEDALTSYGDLYPTLKLKWNSGVHDFQRKLRQP